MISARRPADRKPSAKTMTVSIIAEVFQTHDLRMAETAMSCAGFPAESRAVRGNFAALSRLCAAAVKQSPVQWHSKRVPSGLGSELQIADIDAEARAYSRADRHDRHLVRDDSGEAKTADQVGGAIDAEESLIDRVGGRHVVDEHHGARAVATNVEAD